MELQASDRVYISSGVYAEQTGTIFSINQYHHRVNVDAMGLHFVSRQFCILIEEDDENDNDNDDDDDDESTNSRQDYNMGGALMMLVLVDLLMHSILEGDVPVDPLYWMQQLLDRLEHFEGYNEWVGSCQSPNKLFGVKVKKIQLVE